MNIRTLVVCLSLTALLAACAASPSAAPGQPDPVVTLAREPEVLLLDVRTPQEFASGHVEGAVNVPIGEEARMAELIGRKDRPVLLHCRSGNRSGQVARTLSEQGFTRLHNAGGYADLAEKLGKPVVK